MGIKVSDKVQYFCVCDNEKILRIKDTSVFTASYNIRERLYKRFDCDDLWLHDNGYYPMFVMNADNEIVVELQYNHDRKRAILKERIWDA